MNQNGDISPSDERFTIQINVCAQKSWKRTCPGSDTVTPQLYVAT